MLDKAHATVCKAENALSATVYKCQFFYHISAKTKCNLKHKMPHNKAYTRNW